MYDSLREKSGVLCVGNDGKKEETVAKRQKQNDGTISHNDHTLTSGTRSDL